MYHSIFITLIFHYLILGGMDIVELNERCRFLCYVPGQQFAMHRDGQYTRPITNGDDMDRKGTA